jgi:hypothetical protein
MKIGIIYKLTILAKYKFYGQRPFYVGQHWGMEDFNSYFGGGTIWNDFLNVVKKDYPLHWKKFVRREILYQGACDQRALDFLEQYYIKREMAHYTEEKGGCNVLRGTANAFGAGSPMKDENCKRKQAESLKKYYDEYGHPCLGKRATPELRKRLSEAHRGKKLSPETVEKIRKANAGKKRTPEFCELMREMWRKRKEAGYVPKNRGRKVPREIVEKRAAGVRKYYAEHASSFLGKHHTEATRLKISEANKGKKLPPFSAETKLKMSQSAKKAWAIRKQQNNYNASFELSCNGH